MIVSLLSNLNLIYLLFYKPLFKIIQKDGSLVVKKNLTSKLVTKSKVIYLEEILHYKYSLNQLESKV